MTRDLHTEHKDVLKSLGIPCIDKPTKWANKTEEKYRGFIIKLEQALDDKLWYSEIHAIKGNPGYSDWLRGQSANSADWFAGDFTDQKDCIESTREYVDMYFED